MRRPRNHRSRTAPGPPPGWPADPFVPGAPRRPRRGVRPEIQALRALAVLTVLVYHAAPGALPGGFVGVDVFFAISGFLITAHLLREVDATGRLSARRFWARRARRLLPAALTVLLACAIATLVLVPRVHWQQFLTEIGASTLYVENWKLAGDAVDYLASENRPSPVQHFWSLSAEEQFYLAWPLLIGLAAWAARRRPRPAIGAALAAVTGLSLAYSISATAADPAAAYFVTPARAWEFAAGGLLALLAVRSRLPDGARAALSWAGLGAIGYAAVAYGDETPFPGSAAVVPVLGALAVIHAGMPAARWGPARLLALRPAQAIGDLSYSLYLWHWPLLVLAPFALAAGDGPALRVGAIALALVAAAATKRLVEDPVRDSAWLTSRPRVTFAASGAATAVVAVVLAAGATLVQAQIRDAERRTASIADAARECFGAPARDPHDPCRPRLARTEVVPPPVAARTGPNAPCRDLRRDGPVTACDFGTPPDAARGAIALVGDSHAAHLRAPLDAVARGRRWAAVSLTRSSCPFSTVRKVLSARAAARCRAWVRELPRWLGRRPRIGTLFVVAKTGSAVRAPRGSSPFEAQVDGFLEAWRSLPASVRRVVVIRDTPTIEGDTVDCIERAIAAGRPAGPVCAVPRAEALEADPQAVAARRAAATGEGGARGFAVVDLTRVLCSSASCFPVIGGALVYKDTHHFTRVFARTLAGPLERELARAERGR